MRPSTRKQPQLTLVKRQTGVALITAILLVALATALATKLAWDNHVSMRRTESTLAMEQARLIALGGEAALIGFMREHDNPDVDHFGEDWASADALVFNVGIDDTDIGMMKGTMRDATARFNLNNLVQPNGVDQNASNQFTNLLAIVQAELRSNPKFKGLQLPPTIVDNVIDWIDSDTVPYKSGAEDGSYTSLEIPYRPANNYLISASELRSVYGNDASIYAALADYITALPPGWCRGDAGEPTRINLNTASPEVLEALDPVNGPDWVQRRPFDNMSQVSFAAGGPMNQYVDIKTRCFELHITVAIGRSVLTMYSLLERSGPDGKIFTTRIRTFGLDPE